MILLIAVVRAQEGGRIEEGMTRQLLSAFVEDTPHCLAAVKNRVLDTNGMPLPHVAEHVHAIVQFWFPAKDDALAAVASKASATLSTRLGDVRLAADWMLARRNVSIPYPQGEGSGDALPPHMQPQAPHLKRMTLLRRRAGTTREKFSEWWRTTHVPIVLENMGTNLMGYAQNQVLGSACARVEPLCDGVTELVIDNVQTMVRLFPERDRNYVTGHANAMISAMSSYTVRAVRLR